jgi:hypothetical protein
MSFFYASPPPPSGSNQPQSNPAPSASSSTATVTPSVDSKSEITAVSSSKIPVSLSSSALRAVGRRSRSSRLSKGRFDRAFNELGTALPFKVARNIPYTSIDTTQLITISNFLTSSTIVETDVAYQFELDTLPQYTTWRACFDQYRVSLLEIWLTPQLSQISTAAATNPGLLISCVDLDDAVSLNYSQISEYESAIVSHGIDGHYRRWTPCVATAAYAGGYSGFEGTKAPWIDFVSGAVQHYGFKAAITSTTQQFQFDLLVRAHLQFRGIR